MIKQLLNSISQNIVICQCLADQLFADAARYFAQPHPIIVYYFTVRHDRTLAVTRM